jgi:MFS family permease
MFMGSTLLTPLYAVYREEFGFSEITLTLIYAAYVVGNLGALFVFGRLSDQIGRRRVTLAAIALGAVSTVVFLCASGTAWLFVGRALSGLAIGLASSAGTAWIAELTERQNKRKASIAATDANFTGLAVGALLMGLLAQYAPAPLHLTYVVYLVLLAVMAFLVAKSQETVRETVDTLQETSLRPRIGVPSELRARFVSPAVTAFSTFALTGFYIALVPSLLRRDMDISSLAVAGAVVCWLFAIAAVAVYVTGRIKSRAAMLSGIALLIPSVGVLVAAQALESLPILLVGTALSGVSAALGYRGSLQVVNEMAPGDKRAELISAFQIVCYLGNALPVVAVAVISSATSPMIATISLAGAIALLSIVALAMELRGDKGQHAQLARGSSR